MNGPDLHRSRLLIIDDDPSAIQVLGQFLAPLGEIRFALTGHDGIRLARETTPDLVLLDAELPDLSGLAVCTALKAEPTLAEVPVIFVTSHNDDGSEIAALESGAADFIRKPPRAPVVLARVRTQLRLKHLADALRLQAKRDGLTGIANRHLFNETLANEWLRACRSGKPLSLAMLDVDFFKRFNDMYGHPMGDDCLRRVAGALKSALHRPADLVARYGGEEFVVLMPDTAADGALHVADSLRQAVAQLAIPHADSAAAPCVTVSVGVTTVSPRPAAEHKPAASEALVIAADQALYDAKHAGRARVVVRQMPADAGAGAPAADPAG